MLNNAAKKQLRAMGQSLPVLVQIGKEGLSGALVQNLNEQLEAHELVKVGLLKTAPEEVREAAIDCAGATHADVVHMIGRTFLLYRASKENKLGIRL